ncbi:ferredoxin-type protein NapF [Wenzhouxiangella sp. AB-CW3]|uniref:ferredoxin-type protein NapF n=1 Tax=Wenzhouxiangella sp. AB-CW3 TaxID=2771012 RepID=UPI00168B1BD2|nr:ferredoxin-type protein NapF [Wenzhouxiangella sp. AB-CW3]QOC22451.1 ferredoxin-type protein NapF [Wenzhouxiangella sp. AB-CW3]
MNARREFFLRLVGRKPALRPPWTAADFADRCTGCGDCIPVCPEGVLVAGRAGIPQMAPRGDGCIQCGACVEACEEGVFEVDRPAFPWQVAISERCLTHIGVSCRSCEEACPEMAIGFRLAPGGVSRPFIDQDACTGCSACLPVCPQQAIELHEAGRKRA